MAIQITYNAGVYEINGMLIAQNDTILKSHIEAFIRLLRGLSLNKSFRNRY
jgi:hypothetical protein